MTMNDSLRDAIKQLIWNHIPYNVEVAIRSIIEPGFRKRHIQRLEQTCRYIADRGSAPNRGAKISVVFFCHFPSVWNASASAFQAALEDPDIEVHLIALPKMVVTENGEATLEKKEKNLSYEYCRVFFPNVINAYDEQTQSWFDIRTLKPDYIVLSRPYDKELQPGYQSGELAKYAKICYIPYSYCKMMWDSRVVYGCDFMDHVYAVFTENPLYCRMVRRIFHGTFNARWKKIEYVGYPRFDLHSSREEQPGTNRKTILWLPRWTTKGLLEQSTFFQYKDALLEYMKKHPQFQLICRPHPLMFDNFVSTGEMTESEVRDFKRLFKNTENLLLDESGDYIPAFKDADVFVSDTSSLLIEEFITGKPIIFCGSVAHFDRDAREWARMMYPVHDQKELINRLGELLGGHESEKVSRDHFIKEHLKHNHDCGKRVIGFIKKDYLKGFVEEDSAT